MLQICNLIYIYFLTLNSHLPVTANFSDEQWQKCHVHQMLVNEPELCRSFILWTEAFEHFISLALQAEKPTRLIIVGDHAPPFLEDRLRTIFSPNDVPYVELVPKL